MQLLVLDASGRILAERDISGTTWEATYNGFFNTGTLISRCTSAGYPARIELRDDTRALLLLECPWSSATNYLELGAMLHHKPGAVQTSFVPKIERATKE